MVANIRRTGTPLGACLKISAVMWEFFYKLEGTLNGDRGMAGARSKRQRTTGDDQVLALRRTLSPAAREDGQ